MTERRSWRDWPGSSVGVGDDEKVSECDEERGGGGGGELGRVEGEEEVGGGELGELNFVGLEAIGSQTRCRGTEEARSPIPWSSFRGFKGPGEGEDGVGGGDGGGGGGGRAMVGFDEDGRRAANRRRLGSVEYEGRAVYIGV